LTRPSGSALTVVSSLIGTRFATELLPSFFLCPFLCFDGLGLFDSISSSSSTLIN